MSPIKYNVRKQKSGMPMKANRPEREKKRKQLLAKEHRPDERPAPAEGNENCPLVHHGTIIG